MSWEIVPSCSCTYSSVCVQIMVCKLCNWFVWNLVCYINNELQVCCSFFFMLRTTLYEGLNALLLIYCVSDGKFLWKLIYIMSVKEVFTYVCLIHCYFKGPFAKLSQWTTLEVFDILFEIFVIWLLLCVKFIHSY